MAIIHRKAGASILHLGACHGLDGSSPHGIVQKGGVSCQLLLGIVSCLYRFETYMLTSVSDETEKGVT